jgi:transcriptional regulator with XRE-family HTH domain
MTNSAKTLEDLLNRAKETRGFIAELSQKTGIKGPQLQRYITGKNVPGLDILDRIAKALGIDPWELIKPPGAEIAAHARPVSPAEALDALGIAGPMSARLASRLAALDALLSNPETLRKIDDMIKNELTPKRRNVGGGGVNNTYPTREERERDEKTPLHRHEPELKKVIPLDRKKTGGKA